MDVMLVLKAFTMLADLTTQEAEQWRPLCHWAVASLFGRLRTDVDLAANQTLLCYAAGTMAYYKYVLRNAVHDGTATFAAGDVKVTDNTHRTVEAAKALYEDAIASVSHLFEIDFEFMGVAWQ